MPLGDAHLCRRDIEALSALSMVVAYEQNLDWQLPAFRIAASGKLLAFHTLYSASTTYQWKTRASSQRHLVFDVLLHMSFSAMYSQARVVIKSSIRPEVGTVRMASKP